MRVRVLAAGVVLARHHDAGGRSSRDAPGCLSRRDGIWLAWWIGSATVSLEVEPGQIVAALPIHGAYAEFVCLPQRELVPVPSGLDAAEAVSLVLNYVTAYQMLHRLRQGQTGPARVDSRRGRRGRLGTLAAWAPRAGWRCTGPVHREGRRPFPTSAVSQLITSIR